MCSCSWSFCSTHCLLIGSVDQFVFTVGVFVLCFLPDHIIQIGLSMTGGECPKPKTHFTSDYTRVHSCLKGIFKKSKVLHNVVFTTVTQGLSMSGHMIVKGSLRWVQQVALHMHIIQPYRYLCFSKFCSCHVCIQYWAKWNFVHISLIVLYLFELATNWSLSVELCYCTCNHKVVFLYDLWLKQW